MEYAILKPPKEIFKSPSPGNTHAQVFETSNIHTAGEFPVDYVVLSDGKNAKIYYPLAMGNFSVMECPDNSGKQGIYRHKKGLLHPVKGWPNAEAFFALNAAKQTIMAILLSLNWRMFIGFAFTSRKQRISFLEDVLKKWLRPFHWLLSQYVLKDEYYGQFSSELRRWIYVFLTELGIRGNFSDPHPMNIASGISEVFAMIFDSDDTYRYRLEDILSETSATLLSKNPRREICRLLAIVLSRLGADLPDKFQRIASLSMLFYIPSVKKAFIQATQSVNFHNLQYDDADRYHVLYRTDYTYLGRTFDERRKEFAALHGAMPDAIQI